MKTRISALTISIILIAGIVPAAALLSTSHDQTARSSWSVLDA